MDIVSKKNDYMLIEPEIFLNEDECMDENFILKIMAHLNLM